MWAEDDLGPGAPPCLESYIEPVCGQVYIMAHPGRLVKTSKSLASSGLMMSCLEVASTSAEIYRRLPDTL